MKNWGYCVLHATKNRHVVIKDGDGFDLVGPCESIYLEKEDIPQLIDDLTKLLE